MAERLKQGYLQWRCRRGTKELDVILNRFLDSQYDMMNDVELTDFNKLLDSQDTILWDWLSGQVEAGSEPFKKLVARITIR